MPRELCIQSLIYESFVNCNFETSAILMRITWCNRLSSLQLQLSLGRQLELMFFYFNLHCIAIVHNVHVIHAVRQRNHAIRIVMDICSAFTIIHVYNKENGDLAVGHK